MLSLSIIQSSFNENKIIANNQDHIKGFPFMMIFLSYFIYNFVSYEIMSCLKETITATRIKHRHNFLSQVMSNDRPLDHLNLKTSQFWPIVMYSLSHSPYLYQTILPLVYPCY